MANIIRTKRSTGSTNPSQLANAELAFKEGNEVLLYGKGTGGAGGSATSIIEIGGKGAFVALAETQTITGNKTFTGVVDLSSATVQSFTCNQNLTVTGNLTVNGTTTTVNSTTVSLDDKNLELGSTSSPSDAGASGGGITLKGSTDKTFNWIDSTDSWTSSENIELAANKVLRIDGVSVLSKTSLGSTVTGSSLTSVGTITSGTWNGTTIAISSGGTGATTASGARSNLGVQAAATDLSNLSSMQSGASAALALLTSTELAILDGATLSTANLNVLDGITATTTELNYVDGVTSAIQTQLDTKLDANSTINGGSF